MHVNSLRCFDFSERTKSASGRSLKRFLQQSIIPYQELLGNYNTDAQRALGQKIADWGADVIIGTHPHVIQPVELLTAAGTGKTVPIAYSLGNFVSTQAAANNMVGVILTFDITKTTQPDGSASASVGNVHAVPMVMHYDSNYTNARAYLYRDYTEELAAAHGVRARFSGFSKEYITQLLTEYISPEFLVLE